MSFQARLRNSQKALAATTLLGAAGTTVAGNSLLVDRVQAGSVIGARVTAVIQTGSLTISPQVQASTDGSTWLSLVAINNAAPVTITASATKVLAVPAQIPYKFMRVLVTTAGATATTGDTVAIVHDYVESDFS